MKGLGRAAHHRVSGCTGAQRTRRQFATDKEASKLNNNRGTSRRRGRGNNRPQPTGRSGGMDQGNRIDSRARGNATQMLEKYKKMAHDAQMNGDRVATEYYLQFADHYFRVLADNRARQDEYRRPREDQGRDAGSDYADDDDDNGGYPGQGNSQRGYTSSLDHADEQSRGNQDDDQDEGDDDNRGNIRPANRQNEGRQNEGRQNDSRQNEGRQNEARRERRPREDRPDQRDTNRDANRNDDTGGERPSRQRNERTLRPQPRDDASQAPSPAASSDGDQAPPRRGRGRPPRAVEASEGNGLDPMILPPAIGAAPEAASAESEAAKPKRRAAPRRKAAESGDVEAAAADS
ncbi:MAG: DUF4167 domain-containing protein [Blastomonas fulva]|uniref:DUF4167 domain-containing protein n=2 Tax=Blastomonas fulva TaxID=1550728 RepID=UPI004033A52C